MDFQLKINPIFTKAKSPRAGGGIRVSAEVERRIKKALSTAWDTRALRRPHGF
jgi:hypothetical protein